jgi:hypothetical protein
VQTALAELILGKTCLCTLSRWNALNLEGSAEVEERKDEIAYVVDRPHGSIDLSEITLGVPRG